ncbi:hypothetical protein [Bacillus cereus group sp. BfR-BA-01312]|nr:hypothetical protein [Bacillus cereus group sp. BfR-BA-01312]MDA2130796.1 hypothetical protein [Bacillus cereus]MDA2526440.1 hypothetical protein [Bacillus cereus]
MLAFDTKEKIENITWHIENNRDICGDTKILNEVLTSLKEIVNQDFK